MSRTEDKILGALCKKKALTKWDIAESIGYDAYTVGKVLLKLKKQGRVTTLRTRQGRQLLYVPKNEGNV